MQWDSQTDGKKLKIYKFSMIFHNCLLTSDSFLCYTVTRYDIHIMYDVAYNMFESSLNSYGSNGSYKREIFMIFLLFFVSLKIEKFCLFRSIDISRKSLYI